MMALLLRPAVAADLDHISALWQTAFSDPAPLVQRMLTEGALMRHAVVAELDGHAASVMFAFPDLHLAGKRAAYLYALCTRPDVRGQGLGAAVLAELSRRCFARGAELVFLSPADPGLSRWYQRLDFAPLGAMTDAALPLSPAAAAVDCDAISYADYHALRAAPDVTPGLLRAQGILLEAAGGGYFRLALPGGPGLACAVPSGPALLVLELRCAPADRDAALVTLSRRFSRTQLRLRQPGDGPLPLLYRCADGGAVTPDAAPCFPFLMD